MSILRYELTILILRFLRIKKAFSRDPINYIKIRKGDKLEPPKSLIQSHKINEFQIEETKVFEILPHEKLNDVKKLILFIPGGAFISGPAEHHWTALEHICAETKVPTWLINYPKAPESDIIDMTRNIDAVYKQALEKYKGVELILIGDSVGANLAMTLAQRLVIKNEKLPKKLILITPVFDASLTNSAVDYVNKIDPMLSKKGVLSSKRMCANGIDLKNPIISPLYGQFSSFPDTMLFIAGRDIMYPDGLIGVEKMREAQIKLELIEDEKMPHIFPLLPVMTQATEARLKIIDRIKAI